MQICSVQHPGSVLGRRPRARRAFTLLEVLAVILVIALLIGILSVGFNALTSNATASALRQDLTAMRNAVSRFEDEFNFLPPLVEDGASPRVDRAEARVAVYDTVNRDPAVASAAQAYLRDENEPRFSIHSIAYYLSGALDAAIDGVEGAGMRTPRTDGSFNTRGQERAPMLDPGAGGGVSLELRGADASEGDLVIVDRYGTPYRYYRWLPEASIGAVADLNVPPLVGDPAVDDQLKSARYAIVSAGANGVFGDEPLMELREALSEPSSAAEAAVRSRASADNVVEVGG